jgi:exodeoxyribonuclease VII large subunit
MDKIVFSVSELNNLIKTTLNKKITGIINIRGEISGLKINKGNIYANIKDETATLSIIMWGASDKINITNGDLVTATGRLEYYVKSGYINFLASKIESEGIGDLAKEYENRKLKYSQMGYFDNSKKRKEPIRIDNIGIVTSVDGAALQDVLYVLNKNKFVGNVYIKNCVAQGAACPKSVASGINYFQTFETPDKKQVDAILITRGGGSFEDLMGFSDSSVLDAIHKSNIFTVSAVGHEVDSMLSDFVADFRAPTPSIGAEHITKINSSFYSLIYNSESIMANLQREILTNISYHIETLKHLSDKVVHPSVFLENNDKYLTDTNNNLYDYMCGEFGKRKQHLYHLKTSLEGHNWQTVLNVGFCMLLDNDVPIKSVKTLAEMKKQKLKIVLADGELDITFNITQ